MQSLPEDDCYEYMELDYKLVWRSIISREGDNALDWVSVLKILRSEILKVLKIRLPIREVHQKWKSFGKEKDGNSN